VSGVRGKVVVVTGAGRGQGAAEARLLAAEGATVVGVDLTPEPAEALPGVEYRQLDVTDETAWTALADDLRRADGVVHGLVANAGITWRARLADLRPEDLSRVAQVNVTGTRTLLPPTARELAPGPCRRAIEPTPTTDRAEAGCLELGSRGIRVNTVHPGYIETPMTAAAAAAFRDANVAETPLGRTGTADEGAPLVAFLVGDDSSFITGAEIPVDGGLTAHGGVTSISDAVSAAS
jgi:NAD(P)-dependent dehydrogenase (short-subunit alcohol dehydrogenase family)